MKRWLLPAAVVAAIAGCVALIALAYSGDGSRPSTASERTVTPTVRAEVEPRTHRFGDTVRLRLELLVPNDQLDPDTLRAGGRFSPYEVVGSPQRQLVDVGSFTVARYTLSLRCIKEACLPGEDAKEFEFPPAGFTWKTQAPPGRRFQDRRLDERRASGSMPTLRIAPGLTPEDLTQTRWRSSVATLPSPGTGISAQALAAIMLGGAAALVAAAAGLLALWASRELGRREDARLVADTPPEPLEQALRLVEGVNSNGDATRRRLALQTLAAELRAAHEPALAGDAERLAWTEDAPEGDDVALLAASVRERSGS